MAAASVTIRAIHLAVESLVRLSCATRLYVGRTLSYGCLRGRVVTRTSKPCFYGGEITANFAKSFGGGVYAGDESQALFDQVDISNNECLNDGGSCAAHFSHGTE